MPCLCVHSHQSGSQPQPGYAILSGPRSPSRSSRRCRPLQLPALSGDAASSRRLAQLAVRRVHFKAAKSDGDVGLSSDYFKYSCCDLAVYISLLFTACWFVVLPLMSLLLALLSLFRRAKDLILLTLPIIEVLH